MADNIYIQNVTNMDKMLLTFTIWPPPPEGDQIMLKKSLAYRPPYYLYNTNPLSLYNVVTNTYFPRLVLFQSSHLQFWVGPEIYDTPKKMMEKML